MWMMLRLEPLDHPFPGMTYFSVERVVCLVELQKLILNQLILLAVVELER